MMSLHPMGKLRLEKVPELLSSRTRMLLVWSDSRQFFFSVFLGQYITYSAMQAVLHLLASCEIVVHIFIECKSQTL